MLPDHSDFVGFSVALDTWNQAYGRGEVVKFNGQTYNTKMYYDATSGQFRCPVTGVYFITLTARKYRTNNIELSVEQQGSVILHTIDTNKLNQWTTASNSRLVTCRQGEVMMVKAVGYTYLTSYTSDRKEAIFSGMLIADGKYAWLYITDSYNLI